MSRDGILFLLTPKFWQFCFLQFKVKVAVTQIVKSEMDNSENVTAFDIQAKLNSIIERTYHCVVDQKKKKPRFGLRV